MTANTSSQTANLTRECPFCRERLARDTHRLSAKGRVVAVAFSGAAKSAMVGEFGADVRTKKKLFARTSNFEGDESL
jgi:hypothetical protein